jgi:hypothetical protein
MFEVVKKHEPQPDDPWLIRHRVLGGVVTISALIFFVYLLLTLKQ